MQPTLLAPRRAWPHAAREVAALCGPPDFGVKRIGPAFRPEHPPAVISASVFEQAPVVPLADREGIGFPARLREALNDLRDRRAVH